MLNYLKELLTLSKLFKFKRIFGVFFSTFVVVQFSMTDLSRLASGPPSARLDYYTTLQTLCQELF